MPTIILFHVGREFTHRPISPVALPTNPDDTFLVCMCQSLTYSCKRLDFMGGLGLAELVDSKTSLSDRKGLWLNAFQRLSVCKSQEVPKNLIMTWAKLRIDTPIFISREALEFDWAASLTRPRLRAYLEMLFMFVKTEITAAVERITGW